MRTWFQTPVEDSLARRLVKERNRGQSGNDLKGRALGSGAHGAHAMAAAALTVGVAVLAICKMR